KLDKVHLARYSPRPKTVSARKMDDDVAPEEKKRRHAMLEDLQAQISAEINGRYLGQTVEVLIENQHKGKWRGRTPQNKLVFFADDTQNWRGKLATVEIIHTSPWSMQGRLPGMLGEVGTNSVIPLRVVGS
ncbi:MAG: TRAM domain-containing protein, partial [Anaerolineae bacterium]|nr:TRAM domain-containing protein [Anaerolineae bacterium]